MNQWVRLYRSSLHNPKIVSLNDRLHRVWHNSLLMADESGYLPPIRDIACHLRFTIQEAEQALCELIETGLVDVENPGTANRKLRLHDWTTHQYVSDTSTERVRKFRSKNNGNTNETERNVSVTPSDSETESESEPKFLPSEQATPRAKEHGFDLGFLKGQGKAKGGQSLDKLVTRAEGLGLPVDELVDAVARKKPDRPAAYFTTLCVNRLKPKLPGLDEQLIRDALWGKGAAFGTVCNLLMLEPAS